MNGYSNWLDRLLARFFEYQEITNGCDARNEGEVYLRRFFVRRVTGDASARNVYIHHLLRDDADEELHDHPWSFWSFIFWGGYIEERIGKPRSFWLGPEAGPRWRKWYGAPRVLRRDAKARHRLLVPGPSWSFVVTGKKEKSWSFFGRDGTRTPWREFLAKKC